jgi:hypothetical protein
MKSAMITASDLNVSRETFEKLELLERELRRWQAIKNLVGPATLDRIWDRHIVDGSTWAPAPDFPVSCSPSRERRGGSRSTSSRAIRANAPSSAILPG